MLGCARPAPLGCRERPRVAWCCCLLQGRALGRTQRTWPLSPSGALQMRKQRHREGKPLAQGHTAGKRESLCPAPKPTGLPGGSPALPLPHPPVNAAGRERPGGTSQVPPARTRSPTRAWAAPAPRPWTAACLPPPALTPSSILTLNPRAPEPWHQAHLTSLPTSVGRTTQSKDPGIELEPLAFPEATSSWDLQPLQAPLELKHHWL